MVFGEGDDQGGEVVALQMRADRVGDGHVGRRPDQSPSPSIAGGPRPFRRPGHGAASTPVWIMGLHRPERGIEFKLAH